MTKTANTLVPTPSADYEAAAIFNLPKGKMDIPFTPGRYEDVRLANEWGRDALMIMVANNGVEPQLAKCHQNAEAAKIQREHPAAQITRIAKTGSMA